MSQSNLERERKAEYAHDGRSVLSFLDREFWDPEEGGYFSNPYGKLVKLCHEQAMVAIAHFSLYNITRERKYLERGEIIMDHLAGYHAPEGGCNRVIGDQGPFHIAEQALVARAYMQAYRNTGSQVYRETYLDLVDFMIFNLSMVPEESGEVLSWWDPASGDWAPGESPVDYFEPANTLFRAYLLEGNQTYLDAAKRILFASERLWDEFNYGYSHGEDDDLRYSRDHVIGALAYLSAYDVTNRKDYLVRATDILFYMVSRMGDQVSRTFYEAISRKGEVRDPPRKLTIDHLLLVQAYFYAHEVTLEDKYLNQGRSLLDSILVRGFDKSVGSFTDQVGGGVMGDLEVQVYGSMTLIKAYDVLTVGPSPLIAIVVISVLVILVIAIGILFRKSWPY
jgi:uncharacterized protein YyaL (SSP411 family)